MVLEEKIKKLHEANDRLWKRSNSKIMEATEQEEENDNLKELGKIAQVAILNTLSACEEVIEENEELSKFIGKQGWTQTFSQFKELERLKEYEEYASNRISELIGKTWKLETEIAKAKNRVADIERAFNLAPIKD